VSLISKLHRSDACRRYRGAPGCSPASSRARARPRNSAQFSSPNIFNREKAASAKALVNASGRIVVTARLIAFREPRERYQQGDAKVIAVGFIFALETLGF
jgi:hypothetical protein